MIYDLPDQVEVKALLPADSYAATTTNGSAVDVSAYEGRLLVVWDAEAVPTAGTADLTIQEREDAADSWANIPADALQEVDSDTADTFDQVTTAAAKFQVLAIDKNRVKAQLRAVLVVVTNPDVCSVHLVGTKKYV
jgi:hypothetical protein